MRNLFVALLLSVLLSGCASVTNEGLVFGGTFLIRPVTDYRVPSPVIVEALAEIAEETGEKCINLQTASVETLQLIIHIGPFRANHIADLRNLFTFESVDDLRIIGGLAERRLADIREQGLVCDNAIGGRVQTGGGEI